MDHQPVASMDNQQDTDADAGVTANANVKATSNSDVADFENDVVMGIPIDDVTAARLLDQQEQQHIHSRKTRHDTASVSSMASSTHSFSSSIASSTTSLQSSARHMLSQRASQARTLVGVSPQAFVVFGGYLRLRESSKEWRMKTWYCALLRTHVYFYASKRDATRAMHLHRRVAVSPQGASSSNGQGTFHTYAHAFTFRTTRGEQFFCSAPNASEQKQWIEQLNAAAKAAEQAATALTPQTTRSNDDGRMSMHGSILSSTTGAGGGNDDDDEDDEFSNGDSSMSRSVSNQDDDTQSMAMSSVSSATISTGKAKGCFTCGSVFGKLRNQRRTCRSCSHSFCRLHCVHSGASVGMNDVPETGAPPPHSGSSFVSSSSISSSTSSSSSSTRVCFGCLHRQHFVGFVETFTATAIRLIRHDTMNVATAAATQRDNDAQLAMRKELAIVVASDANFTVLNVLCLLKKYVDVPWMFTRTLCMLIPLFERNAAALEEYWTQFIVLFVPLLRLKEPFSPSMQFYLRFVVAVCRRSNAFALRTVWECLAITEDARAKDDRMTMSYVTLLTVACSSFDGNSTYVMRKLLANAPRAQVDAISTALQGFLAIRTLIRENIPKSLSARWLNAICKHDMQLTRELVLRAAYEIDDVEVVLDLFDPSQIGYLAVLARNYIHLPVGAFDLDGECDRADEDDAFMAHKEREFDAQAAFVEQLTAISDALRHVQPVERRNEKLEELLRALELQHLAPRNDEWVAGDETSSPCIHAPLLSSTTLTGGGSMLSSLRLLRVLPSEAKVFSTRSRAPTMIVFEACPVDSRPPRSTTMSLLSATNSGDSSPAPFHDIIRGIPVSQEEEEELFDSELIMSAKLVSMRLRGSVSSRTFIARNESHMLDMMLCGLSKDDDSTSSGGGSDAADESASSIGGGGGGGGGSSDCSYNNSDDGSSRPDELLIQEAREAYEDSVAGPLMASFRAGDSSSARSKWKRNIRAASPFGGIQGWTLVSLIAKSHDDLRQEVFAMQLMRNLVEIFENNELHRLYLRPYEILCTGANVGLIETLTDAQSLDAVKKEHGSLAEYFTESFGVPSDYRFQQAQDAFIRSMAASSLYCYLFQIKDRHNGNIMLDQHGHIVHIDFGFMMGSAPGGAFSLEDAPFKFTREMGDLMGGIGSRGHRDFAELFMDGFLAVRREYIKLLTLIHLATQESPFPCFQNQSARHVLRNFRQRLFLHDADDAARPKIRRLVDKSYNHWGTRQYDRFQFSSNGVLP